MKGMTVAVMGALATAPGLAETVAESCAALGLSLLREQKGNAVLSPWSMQSALVMAWAGARGETREQMTQALRLPPDASEKFADTNRLLQMSVPESRSLSLANRLFGQSGYHFHQDFLALLADAFGAPLGEVDFKAHPAAAAEAINHWVEEKTRGKIRDLVPAGVLNRDARLVLVNALHFLAPWAEAFAEEATSPGIFRKEDGSEVSAVFMRRTGSLSCMEDELFVAVGVPYAGGEWIFLGLLPRGTLAELEDQLTPAHLASLAAMPSREVSLSLPKFRIESPTLRLADALKARGMRAAFDEPRGSADFSGVAPRLPDDYLYISEVLHKAFVDVHEAGTEAAAATAAVMMRATMMPAEPIVVEFNRPFLFAILHKPTAVCLFLGRLTAPESEGQASAP